jgi:hypothetical protein
MVEESGAVKQINKFKADGTECFKKQDYKRAIQNYEEALTQAKFRLQDHDELIKE